MIDPVLQALVAAAHGEADPATAPFVSLIVRGSAICGRLSGSRAYLAALAEKSASNSPLAVKIIPGLTPASMKDAPTTIHLTEVSFSVGMEIIKTSCMAVEMASVDAWFFGQLASQADVKKAESAK